MQPGERAMPFIPAVNTVRLTIDYLSADGEDAANVLHIKNVVGAPTAAQVEDLFDLMQAWYAASWDSAAADNWQTDLMTARVLNVVDDAIYTRVFTHNGTVTGGALPAQDTIAVSARTGFAGASRRGRIFHVGMPKSFSDGSSITNGGSAQILASYADLLTTLSGSDWQYVVASYISNGVPRASALLTPVTNFILTDVILDSMDSRKPTP
jgi:hypothetical protein